MGMMQNQIRKIILQKEGRKSLCRTGCEDHQGIKQEKADRDKQRFNCREEQMI